MWVSRGSEPATQRDGRKEVLEAGTAKDIKTQGDIESERGYDKLLILQQIDTWMEAVSKDPAFAVSLIPRKMDYDAFLSCYACYASYRCRKG